MRRRLLDRTLVYFKRQGAELNDDDKLRLSETDISLAKATNRFAQNVTDATDAYSLTITDESRLSGDSQGALDAIKTTLAGDSRLGPHVYCSDDLRG